MAAKTIPVGSAELPPAGYQRDEELAKRSDQLEEAGEKLAADLEVERIDPKKFKIENEIAQHFDPASTMLEVSNKDSAYMYCWVYSGMHGLMITNKQIEGWVVVQGDDEEAKEHQGIGGDTTRRVGDTLLMKIPKDKYLILDRRRKENARRFDQDKTGISDDALKLAQKHGIPIYSVEDMDARTLKRMMNTAAAKKIGGQITNRLIRQGRMPGAKI